MHQACSTDPQLPGLQPQPSAQRRFDLALALLDATAIALHVTQAERQGRLIDIRQLLAEERFVLLLAKSQAGLGHIIAVRHGGTQLLATPEQAGQQFLLQHFQGDMVHDQVMEQQ